MQNSGLHNVIGSADAEFSCSKLAERCSGGRSLHRFFTSTVYTVRHKGGIRFGLMPNTHTKSYLENSNNTNSYVTLQVLSLLKCHGLALAVPSFNSERSNNLCVASG